MRLKKTHINRQQRRIYDASYRFRSQALDRRTEASSIEWRIFRIFYWVNLWELKT